MEKILNKIMKADSSLRSLKHEICSNDYSISIFLFRENDLSVIPKYYEHKSAIKHKTNDEIRIVTPFALELSWLIFEIRDIFYNYNLVDKDSKDFIFRNLGNAALKYHSKNGDGRVIDLLIAVLGKSQGVIPLLISKNNFALA